MLTPSNIPIKLVREKLMLIRLKKYYEKEDKIHQLQPKEERLLKLINNILKDYYKGVKCL